MWYDGGIQPLKPEGWPAGRSMNDAGGGVLFHGAKDTTVPPAKSIEMVDAIKAAGGDVEYKEFRRAAHNSWDLTYRDDDVIAWLLAQRGWQRGEISLEALGDPKYRLGSAAPTEPEILRAMPPCAQELVRSSEALYERVRRLQENMPKSSAPVSASEEDAPAASPARDLLNRLEEAF